MNRYQFWQESIEGLKPKMFVDDPQLGFYRKGVYERNDKGNNRRVGWTPVAIFMSEDKMVARIGSETLGRDVEGDELNELWSYCAANAISEGMYREVARHGKPWPDAHDPSKNLPAAHPVPEGATAASPENVLADQIAAAQAGISQYDKIDSDTMAGQALSLKNEITTLAGKLEKIRQRLVRPHVDAEAEINGRLNPVIKDAKIASSMLLARIGGWEDQKRAIARQAAEAAEKAERDRLAAAQRAEAQGKPPPPPVVHAPPNAPPPSTQVAAAVGRKASVKVAKFVTDIDVDLAFQHFKGEWAVKNFLLELTQKAVNAGIDVPGATVEERSIVR